MILVMRRRHLLLMTAGVVFAVALLGTGAWWLVEQQRVELVISISQIGAERDRLARENSVVVNEREALSQRLAIVERSTQVKSYAYVQVDEQLEQLQRQVLDLKADVAFYKGIVSEDKGGSRVRIQRLVLEKDGGERDYRFRVVLTRGKQDDKLVRGALALSLDGEQDGEQVRLTLGQLATFPVAKLRFSFKHFQRLEGQLHLPERFVPKRVVIQVNVANSGSEPIRESFAWSIVNS
jgi:hypothetical protein